MTASRTQKLSGVISSTVQGGGKRRPSAAIASTAPILFGLALYCRRRWILDLKPVVDAARPIVRTKPLRDNAFTAKSAGVLHAARRRREQSHVTRRALLANEKGAPCWKQPAALC